MEMRGLEVIRSRCEVLLIRMRERGKGRRRLLCWEKRRRNGGEMGGSEQPALSRCQKEYVMREEVYGGPM